MRFRLVLSYPAWMVYADLASARPLTCPVGPREAWSLGPATSSSGWKGSCSRFLPLGPDKLNMGYKCSKRNLPTAWTYKRLGKSPLKLDPEQAAIKELIHKSRVRLGARLGAGGWAGLGLPGQVKIRQASSVLIRNSPCFLEAGARL